MLTPAYVPRSNSSDGSAGSPMREAAQFEGGASEAGAAAPPAPEAGAPAFFSWPVDEVAFDASELLLVVVELVALN